MSTSSDLIYGIALVKFGGVEIGWLSQDGLQPAGTAPSSTPIYAAQVKDGPVISLLTTPGLTAFTATLIDLSAEAMINVIGGTTDDNGGYEPPEKWEKSGVMDIKCDSGHTIRLYNAKVSGTDFGNGINTSNVLGLGIRIEVMKDANGKRLKTFKPGIDPETGLPEA
ncbi:MAG: hypothetical protein LBN29_01350 [Mediterranea sp.]|jgi:hypothetical protein|nr:hypothetical protein [Mediterranea sp.]